MMIVVWVPIIVVTIWSAIVIIGTIRIIAIGVRCNHA
jgi:hypothetical protein